MCSVCAPFRIGTAIIHWKHTPYLAQRVLRLESPTVPPTKLPSSISYVGVARGRTASVYSRGTLVLESGAADGALRANMDETDLLVVITEQGENRNPCEEQRNIFGFSCFSPGFARRCAT